MLPKRLCLMMGSQDLPTPTAEEQMGERAAKPATGTNDDGLFHE